MVAVVPWRCRGVDEIKRSVESRFIIDRIGRSVREDANVPFS